jgi:hypothetical protein
MTATSQARGAARKASHSRGLELFTRAGFIGYGLIHILVAWIAVQIVQGEAPAEGSQAGAFAIVAQQSAGKWLLGAVAVGLVAMAVWQALAAFVGHTRDRGWERRLERAASAGRAVVYALLAWKAVDVIQGVSKGGGKEQEATASLLARPAGQWLTVLAGLAIAAVGVGLVIYGVVRRFEKHLDTQRMTARTHKVIRWLGVAGYAAKGVAYTVVGVLVVIAAVRFDPSRSRGLDSALQELAQQPFGSPLLLGVAAGIAAFGVFWLTCARYREF